MQQRGVASGFAHRTGALGAGNDVGTGSYTLAEAFAHCARLPDAVGFTHGPGPPPAVRLPL